MIVRSTFAAAAAALLALAACRAETQSAVDAPTAAPVRGTERERAAGAQFLEERIPLIIHSGGRAHRFTVEVARSREQQRRGLMFRESLGDDEGMLFPYAIPAQQSFWMRNTVIPLDIIFIRADGSIARVAAETTPYSLDPIASIDAVVGVLEIDGGRAAELGIAAEDRVSWPGGPPAHRP